MNYDVFVSYSVAFSSRVYELSAQLGRRDLTCYLDCVESGFSLNDYTRGLVAESRLHVVLAGTGFVTTPYAMATLQCALDAQRRVLVCLADGAKLPEGLLERCEVSAEATLADDIVRMLTGAAPTAAPTDAIANVVGMLAGTASADAIAEPMTEPTVAPKNEAEAPADTYLYAPFSPVGEESPLEFAPWTAAYSAADESLEASPVDDGECVADEDEAEPILDSEDYAAVGRGEDDGEEAVYTEHRGEEWLSPSQCETTPPTPSSPPVPEISPERKKLFQIIAWVLFALWLLRFCS